MNNNVTAILLAGGQGRRMKNQDKGLVEFDGIPLIQHVLSRIRPQVQTIVISCNRNIDQYEKLGFPVVTDTLPDYPGPLAGVLSAVDRVTTPVCFIVPTDMPFLPMNIVPLLLDNMESHQAITAEVNGKLEPLVSLVLTNAVQTIPGYLASGRYSVKGWLALLEGRVLPVRETGRAFENMNSPRDLARKSRSRKPKAENTVKTTKKPSN